MTHKARTFQVVNPYLVAGEEPRLPKYVTVNMEPIPWCLTHDSPYSEGWITEEACLQREVRANSEDECELSNGGPDHRWWVDDQPELWIDLR